VQQAISWGLLERDLAAWRKQVRWLDRRLERLYKSPRHGNLDNPTDEVFFILLSKKTPPERYLPVFDTLCHRFRPWERLLRAPLDEVAEVLQPLGMSRIRASQFIQIAHQLQTDFGRVSLESLRTLTLQKAHAYLKGLSGVGEKSARCILMYSLGHDISPMDTHATRVLGRFGLLPEDVTNVSAHRIMDERLPRGIAYRLHVNLVAHGRTVCTAKRPACETCMVAQRCSRQGLTA